ncbi:hypothetical protein [Virgibacillus doumboii]|uniref:hypothetical protein n=1 Tax=Virgibacillus doumboii TaxID=2697503 RepID=UPI0013DFEC22|nr:hypothetical protein [Virgibacillus doumboii]
MEKEDKIIGMLESITERIGGIDKRLDGMDKRFDGIDNRLDGMDKRFDSMDKRLDGMDGRMDNFEQKLEMQGETLKEHGQILRALQSGQEYLRAEIDGMKISNAKEFSSLNEALDDHSIKLELVREDTWANKVDIHRMKTTMGMK